MPKVTYQQVDGTSETLDIAVGNTVMHAAISAGLHGIVAECGGNAMCATCHVYVDDRDGLPPMTVAEDDMLDSTASDRTTQSRLSCQLTVNSAMDGLTVRVPAEQV